MTLEQYKTLKKGTKVRLISRDYWSDKAELEVGKVYKIGALNYEGIYINGWWMKRDQFELPSIATNFFSPFN